MKRALQMSMLTAATIPLVLGIVNLVSGAGRFVPVEQINANLDNQLRFYAVWFTAVFFLTIWCVRNLEIAGPVMQIMFVVMALGGVARLYSMNVVGLPDPPMLIATFIEIAVLLFIPWHAYVMRNQAPAPD